MKRKILSLLVVAALLVLAGGPLVKNAEAANFNYAYMMPSDMTISQTSGVTWYLAMNFPTANMTDPTVTIEFPSADTGWCTSAGTVTVTNVGTTPDLPPDQGSWDAQPHGSATFSNADCEATGAHSISFDITGTLNFATTYGFQIVENAGALGTDDTAGSHAVIITIDDGSSSHTSTIGVPLVTDGSVDLTADVEAAPSVSCTISSVSLDFGVLYQNGAYSTVNHTIQADPSTNAEGYYWVVYGTNGGLDDGTNTISATATTVDLTSGEGFGFDASDPDAGSSATVETDFVTSDGAGTFGSVLDGLSNAKLLLSDITTDGVADTSTITYGARATSAPTGTGYDETVYFVCGGYY